MVILQKINKNQMVKLLDAINREGVDNQFWAVSSYEDSWNAGEILAAQIKQNLSRAIILQ